MIAAPLNDQDCLESITEVVRQVVDRQDPAVVEIARQCNGSTARLVDYIRDLPQRDDFGIPSDGPKVRACRPPQRLRIPADDPNCVERSALYNAAAEMIDPRPVRRLCTIETPWGLHTMPIEQVEPVVLDPRMPRNALYGALFALFPSTFPMAARDAIDWLTTIASAPALQRMALDRIHAARAAMHRILDGQSVSARAIDDVTYTIALARREAPRWGSRGRELLEDIVRLVRERLPATGRTPKWGARRLDDTSPDVLERILATATPMCGQRSQRSVDDLAEAARRNVAIQIGGMTFEPDMKLLAALARIGLRVGSQAAQAALPALVSKLGIPPVAIQVLEGELRKEGTSLRPLLGSMATPLFPSLATLPLLPKPERYIASMPDLGITAADLRNLSWNPQTPGSTLDEMHLTDLDIKALTADVATSFREPFEAQLKQADVQFEKRFGRKPRAGAADDAAIYAMMTPIPTPPEIEFKTYQGNFVHAFGNFAIEWESFYQDNQGWTSRLPFSNTYDKVVEFRRRAKEWREQFIKLGGKTTTPAPKPPEDLLDQFKDAIKWGLWAVGGVLVGAVVLPPLLRRAAD